MYCPADNAGEKFSEAPNWFITERTDPLPPVGTVKAVCAVLKYEESVPLRERHNFFHFLREPPLVIDHDAFYICIHRRRRKAIVVHIHVDPRSEPVRDQHLAAFIQKDAARAIITKHKSKSRFTGESVGNVRLKRAKNLPRTLWGTFERIPCIFKSYFFHSVMVALLTYGGNTVWLLR